MKPDLCADQDEQWTKWNLYDMVSCLISLPFKAILNEKLCSVTNGFAILKLSKLQSFVEISQFKLDIEV